MKDEKSRERDPFAVYEEESKKKMLEREREQRSKDLDNKIMDLANKAVDFILEYGRDDFRSQMMASFLDVALVMKDTIKMLTGINVAMSCIFEAIGFIDSAINFDTILQEGSLKENYGFFARWKRKRRMRKVIRNNRSRMQVAIDNILGQQKMAQDITESLRVASERMRLTMDKREAKRKKTEAKRASDSKYPPISAPGKGQALIAEILKARGEQAPQPKTEGETTSSDDKKGGVGDISDIL